MNILITGALGHIGSSLLRYLPSKYKFENIYLVDNFVSNRYYSLFRLKKNNYEFYELDISKKFSNKIFKKIDLVIHLAAKTDAAQSSKFKKEFYNNNFNATKNIVELCNKKSSKLIFASSTSVYGPQTNVVDENCKNSDLNPQSPYAHVKLKEEKYIKRYLRNNYLILRLGTIYGTSPGIRFHTAVNKFCFQAALNQPITVWKTAFNQVRPYLGVDDFNRSIIHILKNDLVSDNIFNIVSYNLSVRDIINKIKIYKKKLKISFVNHEIMNQLSYNVLNTKFKNTKFNFKSDLEKQIKNTIELFDNAKQ